MSRLYHFYKSNINAIIITLIFHIFVFLVLYFTQLGIKNEIKENEIIIDFSQIEVPENKLPEQEALRSRNSTETMVNKENVSGGLKTNTASNRTSTKQNKSFDDQYEKDIEDAQNLLKDVNRQLKREIPTIDDLKMPDAPGVKPEDLKDKIYTGESNIEYFLENRYHTKLPIPVYLAEAGGKVRVDIVVDRSGNVIKAEPVIQPSLSEQVLSYAKTAALRTKFNMVNNAPEEQKGYIVYHFIPQN